MRGQDAQGPAGEDAPPEVGAEGRAWGGEPASTWVKVFCVVEAAIGMIALLMPITPSKTGSEWDAAEWFLNDPSYGRRALFYFVATNLLVSVFGLVVWVWVRRAWRKRRAEGDGR